MAMTKAEKAVVDELRRKLALRWPDRAKPVRLFGFGDYDRAYGEPQEGTYFVANGRGVEKVVLTKGEGWRSWRFNDSTSVIRGGYFEQEADARLVVLWLACDDAARTLSPLWANYDRAGEPHTEGVGA